MHRTPSLALCITLVQALSAVAPAQAQTVWYVDDDASGDPAPGDPSVSDPLEDGSLKHPFDAIQEGINAATAPDVVTVADGIYTGAGNRDIDFSGKLIVLRSAKGPGNCIIDAQGSGGSGDFHRGFVFRSEETQSASLSGFTIRGGYMQGQSPTEGGGVYCFRSSPTISDCIITGNTTNRRGGGIACMDHSRPLITGCVITDNTAFKWGGGIACDDSRRSRRRSGPRPDAKAQHHECRVEEPTYGAVSRSRRDGQVAPEDQRHGAPLHF